MLLAGCPVTTLCSLAQTNRWLRRFIAMECEICWRQCFGRQLAPHRGHSGGSPRSWHRAYRGWLTYMPDALRTLPADRSRCSDLEDDRQIFAVALASSHARHQQSDMCCGDANLWVVNGRGDLGEYALSSERAHTQLRVVSSAQCAALALDASTADEVLVGSSDGWVRCFDPRTAMNSAVWSIQAHQDEVFCVKRDPLQPVQFATSSAEERILIWDARSCCGASSVSSLQRLEGPAGSIFSVDFARSEASGEAWLFGAGSDKMVHKYDVRSGEWLAVPPGMQNIDPDLGCTRLAQSRLAQRVPTRNP